MVYEIITLVIFPNNKCGQHMALPYLLSQQRNRNGNASFKQWVRKPGWILEKRKVMYDCGFSIT